MSKNVSQAFDQVIEQLKATDYVRNGIVMSSSPSAKKFQYLRQRLTEFTTEVYKKNFSTYRFEDITTDFLNRYVRYSQEQGEKNGNNGNIGDKLKRLKQVFHSAGINNEIIDAIKVEAPTKHHKERVLPPELAVDIRKMDRSSLSAKEQFHIDLFLFSCYTGGTTLLEIAYLTNDSLCGGVITHQRHKTFKVACIPINPYSQAIIDSYKNECYGNYLLPIFTHKHNNESQQRARVKRMAEQVNQTLKKVRRLIGCDCEITLGMTTQLFIERMISFNTPPDIIASYVGCSIETIFKYWEKKADL